FLCLRPSSRSYLFPYTTLFRSGLGWQQRLQLLGLEDRNSGSVVQPIWHHGYSRSLPYWRVQMEPDRAPSVLGDFQTLGRRATGQDRKSTRLNSSHGSISYAVFC